MKRRKQSGRGPIFRERLPVRRWVVFHKDKHDYDRKVNHEIVKAEMESYDEEEEFDENF